MNRNRKNGAGFTLIEVLVVIFVIGTISAMMIVNWRKNESQYQLQRVAQEMSQNIRKVQDMALNGVKATGLTRVPVSYGTSFELMISPAFYKICADINLDNKCTSLGTDIWLKEITLESGTIIDSIYKIKTDEIEQDDSIHIMFSVPDGFVLFSRADTIGAIIRIKRIGTTCPSANCRDIIVRKTGEISIQ